MEKWNFMASKSFDLDVTPQANQPGGFDKFANPVKEKFETA